MLLGGGPIKQISLSWEFRGRFLGCLFKTCFLAFVKEKSFAPRGLLRFGGDKNRAQAGVIYQKWVYCDQWGLFPRSDTNHWVPGFGSCVPTQGFFVRGRWGNCPEVRAPGPPPHPDQWEGFALTAQIRGYHSWATTAKMRNYGFARGQWTNLKGYQVAGPKK